MLQLCYNIINTTASVVLDGVSRTSQGTTWPKHAYRLYVRIAEACSEWRDVLSILRLYHERQSDSDWHNFNVDVTSFANLTGSIVHAFSDLAPYLEPPEIRWNADADVLTAERGLWFSALAEQYSKRVWPMLKKRDTHRVFYDYLVQIRDIPVHALRVVPPFCVEGLPLNEIDFRSNSQFENYYAEIREIMKLLEQDRCRLADGIGRVTEPSALL
jgi:hypothetical protein